MGYRCDHPFWDGLRAAEPKLVGQFAAAQGATPGWVSDVLRRVRVAQVELVGTAEVIEVGMRDHHDGVTFEQVGELFTKAAYA